MNEPVEFGDVLPKDLFDEIGEELFKKGWRLSNKSAKGTKRFWTQHQVDNPIFNRAGNIVLEKVKEYTDESIKLVRIHCNGQTTGQDGAAHVDFWTDNVWTFVLFTNKFWDVRLGGGFNVINPEVKKHQYYQLFIKLLNQICRRDKVLGCESVDSHSIHIFARARPSATGR